MEAGLTAADPEKAVARTLQVEGNRVSADGETFGPERIFILSAGKAAGPMARAAAELLGDRVAGGVVVTKDDHEEGPEVLETLYASHPEPDGRGVEAAGKARELAESLGEGDLLLALISGGASALLADPAPPIALENLQQLTSDLLKSGADIEEINTIRKHVSVLKGGGLAKTGPSRPYRRPLALRRGRRRTLLHRQRFDHPRPDHAGGCERNPPEIRNTASE